jgi:hypothetical protein
VTWAGRQSGCRTFPDFAQLLYVRMKWFGPLIEKNQAVSPNLFFICDRVTQISVNKPL